MPRTNCAGVSLLLLLLCGLAGGLARADETSVRLVFVGDIMLDEIPGQELARGVDVFAAFADTLLGADFTIGNLECVIATCGQKADKSFHFRAAPTCVPILSRYFDALSVANNHSGDFGSEALAEQCDILNRSRLPYFGGGRNLKEAHQPLVIELKGIRIALLGYNEFPPEEFEAGETTPGVAWSHDEQVLRDIRLAREKHHANVVIPFMHWGIEFEPEPSARQRTLARLMIDAGASAVVGGHPHVTQGSEEYRGRPIVYSLGNFVFNGFQKGPQRTGWLLQMSISKQGVTSWETQEAHVDERGIPMRG